MKLKQLLALVPTLYETGQIVIGGPDFSCYG